MRLRYQYLIAGVGWAVLLGHLTFLLLVAIAAGISWLWLFGDSSWPPVMRWVLPLVGVIGGIAAAAGTIVAAYLYGRGREALPRAALRGEPWKILVLAMVPLLLLFVVGLGALRQGRDYTKAMTAATQREAAFATLLGAHHRITDLTVDRSPDDAFHAAVRLAGSREGDYRLRWRVVDRGMDAGLAAGAQFLHLQPGERRVEVTFTLEELARGYQSQVLHGKGGALVDEPFRLDVSLRPVFSDAEREELPPGERRRLESGESPLSSSRSAPFTVRFVIRKDGSLEK
jgi:hypothetical protein